MIYFVTNFSSNDEAFNELYKTALNKRNVIINFLLDVNSLNNYLRINISEPNLSVIDPYISHAINIYEKFWSLSKITYVCDTVASYGVLGTMYGTPDAIICNNTKVTIDTIDNSPQLLNINFDKIREAYDSYKNNTQPISESTKLVHKLVKADDGNRPILLNSLSINNCSIDGTLPLYIDNVNITGCIINSINLTGIKCLTIDSCIVDPAIMKDLSNIKEITLKNITYKIDSKRVININVNNVSTLNIIGDKKAFDIDHLVNFTNCNNINKLTVHDNFCLFDNLDKVNELYIRPQPSIISLSSMSSCLSEFLQIHYNNIDRNDFDYRDIIKQATNITRLTLMKKGTCLYSSILQQEQQNNRITLKNKHLKYITSNNADSIILDPIIKNIRCIEAIISPHDKPYKMICRCSIDNLQNILGVRNIKFLDISTGSSIDLRNNNKLICYINDYIVSLDNIQDVNNKSENIYKSTTNIYKCSYNNSYCEIVTRVNSNPFILVSIKNPSTQSTNNIHIKKYKQVLEFVEQLVLIDNHSIKSVIDNSSNSFITCNHRFMINNPLFASVIDMSKISIKEYFCTYFLFDNRIFLPS
jgi:hypothetical protein